jgi:glycosyltransferase involved in cell wall biosynthesis
MDNMMNRKELMKENEELKRLLRARILGPPLEMAITFLGRIHKQKGLVHLLEAWEQIREEYPNFRLQIVGDYNNAYGKELKSKFHKQVRWIGYVSDREELIGYLLNSHCIVLPSLFEGTPLTLFESLASGRPVICSDIPAMKQICKKTEAIFFKVKDVKDLAAKISWTIEHPQEADAIGRKGMKVAEKYDWAKIVIQTQEVYDG